ncbi:hypothetical protein GO730_28230 [Spirosoma sp. HMF3257]|uniref:DUF4403 family protein n=1 Tax=Spirosoma telluris TaxID=2183553 RepID=A0A327NQU6_9BACT|nr:hypothetical protein [Spirosoma telluris]RAI77095.1 hypothetical protein HMF3257_28175 [Spirosoma telluris]
MFLRTLLFLSLSILAFLPSYAQGNLAAATQAVANQLSIVKIGAGQYTQKLEATRAPHRLTFLVTQTDAKGKAHDESYHLNVADLDPAQISFKPSKDVIVVTAGIRLNRKFIRYAENGQPGNFIEKLTLYAESPDAATAMVDALRKLALAAEKSYHPASLPDGYEDIAVWLKNAVVNEVIGLNSYEQSISYNGRNPLLATFKQNKAGKSDDQFGFNVADISLNDVKLTAKGDHLELSLTTLNRDKFIRYIRAGKPADLTSEFALISTDVDRIRDIEAAFRKLIPLAQKRLEAQTPSLKSMADIQKVVIAGTRSVVSDRESFNQQIVPECSCMYTRIQAGRQTPIEEISRFSLDDIPENSTKIDISNGLFVLKVNTGKQRLISVSKNLVRQNYSADLEIFSEDLEAVRFLPQAFTKAAQLCRQARKSPVPTNTAAATLSWLTTQMPSLRSETEELKTTLETFEPNSTCHLRLTERIIGKKTVETQYDMSLKFLNVGGLRWQ